MAKKRTPTVAPICPECGQPTRLVTGKIVYPKRFDLHAKKIWLCNGCDAYVGCHGDTDRPLGIPANHALRYARMRLHDDRIDPIWKTADRCGLYRPENEAARKQIRLSARGRVYAFLADKLGLTTKQTHTGMFTIEQCRIAWRALTGVTYQEIRDWHKAKNATEILAESSSSIPPSDRPSHMERLA